MEHVPDSAGSSSRQDSTRSVRHDNNDGSTSANIGVTSGESGRNLRRGHSDGDVLLPPMGTHRRMTVDGTRENAETWMDFIREPQTGEEDDQERVRAAARRAAIVAADRKRRLQETRDDYTRRRSASTMSLGHFARNQMKQQQQPAAHSNAAFPQSFHPPSRRTTSIDTNRPLPQTPSITSPKPRLTGEIVLPRWQPDSEVSECPICGRTFTFWFRKHHCRKCGRVVCTSCSPHRITIPRQFIVHPPADLTSGMVCTDSGNIEVIDLTEEDEQAGSANDAPVLSPDVPHGHDSRLDPALGGGQEVRLCNPCVPDPNPAPPPTYPSPNPLAFSSFPTPEIVPFFARERQFTPSGSGNSAPPSHASRPNPHSTVPWPERAHETPGMHAPFTLDSYHVGGPQTAQPPSEPYRREINEFLANSRNYMLPSSATSNAYLTFNPQADSRLRAHSQQIPPSPANDEEWRPLSSSAPRASVHDTDYLSRHRSHASTSTIPTQPRYRSMLDVTTPLPPRPPPQPILREEDECPICHSALPPQGPDGSETARETHVAACIDSHFSTSSSSYPTPQNAVSSAGSATSIRPVQTSGLTPTISSESTRPEDPSHTQSQPPPLSSTSHAQQQQQPLPPRRRIKGMRIYNASEKDCVGENGEEQECVICFEEFAPGQEMGRLECLCKFHAKCIRQWWDTKGVGACPVHQEPEE